MGKINNLDQIHHKKEQEKKRQKAKSGRPTSGPWIDPMKHPQSTIRATYLDIPKDKWEKAFGKKDNKKKSSKKT